MNDNFNDDGFFPAFNEEKNGIKCIFADDGKQKPSLVQGEEWVWEYLCDIIDPGLHPGDMTAINQSLKKVHGFRVEFAYKITSREHERNCDHFRAEDKYFSGLPNSKKVILFHGTKDNGIRGVVKSSALKRPPKDGVDKFGKGIYFARACHAVDYTSGNGKRGALLVGAEVLMCKERVGKQNESFPEDIDTFLNRLPRPFYFVKPADAHQHAIRVIVVLRSCMDELSLDEIQKLTRFGFQFLQQEKHDAIKRKRAEIEAEKAKAQKGAAGKRPASDTESDDDSASAKRPKLAAAGGPAGGAAGGAGPGSSRPAAPVAPATALNGPFGGAAPASAKAPMPTAGAAVVAPTKAVLIQDECTSAKKKYHVGDTVWVPATLARRLICTNHVPGHKPIAAIVVKCIMIGPTNSLCLRFQDCQLADHFALKHRNAPVVVHHSTDGSGLTYTVPKDVFMISCRGLTDAPAPAPAAVPAPAPAAVPAPAPAAVRAPAPAAAPAAAPAVVPAPVQPQAQSAAGGAGASARVVCGSCNKCSTWNGLPGHCCRTCRVSGGRSHGPACASKQHMESLLTPGSL